MDILLNDPDKWDEVSKSVQISQRNEESPEIEGGTEQSNRTFELQGCSDGCSYQDIVVKISKHRTWFCEQCTRCPLCHTSLHSGTLSHHFSTKHRATSKFVARRDCGGWFLMNSTAGHIVTWYCYTNSWCTIRLRTAIPAERLHEYRCVMLMGNSPTVCSRVFTPGVMYDKKWDWEVSLQDDELLNGGRIFVHVDLMRVEKVVGLL